MEREKDEVITTEKSQRVLYHGLDDQEVKKQYLTRLREAANRRSVLSEGIQKDR